MNSKSEFKLAALEAILETQESKECLCRGIGFIQTFSIKNITRLS